MDTSVQPQRDSRTQANPPLQQQLDEITAQAMSRLPADMQERLSGSVGQLIASGAVEHALKEGEQAPYFTLPDALGNPLTLSNLLKQGPVVLIFYRGAWCPYCNLQLHAYQQMLPQIQALGASLVAISPQTPDHSLTFAEKKALTFAVLSDSGNKVAQAYGLVFQLDEAVRTAYRQMGTDLPAYNGDDSWELPMPGTFLVDQSGSVRLASVNPDFTRRLDPSTIIAQLKQH
ncbi:MAG: AhpC/TSA family protein [Ktedonobacteraceae bacterium]|nr:AhpC/TSA family protein [Ktedonobacteraceae bacterium]